MSSSPTWTSVRHQKNDHQQRRHQQRHQHLLARRAVNHSSLVPLIDLVVVGNHRIQKLDQATLLLIDGKEAVLFTPTEYRMVIPMLQDIGEPVPFEQLIEVKGSFDRQRDRELFHRHITSIRKKLRPLGLLVRCVTNYGYLITPEPKYGVRRNTNENAVKVLPGSISSAFETHGTTTLTDKREGKA
jgi:hypothetical protein